MGEVSGDWDPYRSRPDLWYPPTRPEELSEEEDEDGDWVGFASPWLPPRAAAFRFQRPEENEPVLDPPAPPRALGGGHMAGLPPAWSPRLTAEEAERNARELLAEEEREKRKAEKKKMKKKKQKDRKKREKLGQEAKSEGGGKSPQPPSDTAGADPPQSGAAEDRGVPPGHSPPPLLGASAAPPGEEELEEELDPSCPFVLAAQRKAGLRPPGTKKAGSAPHPPPLPCPPVPPAPAPDPPDASAVEQSLILAGHGNAAARQGRYAEAVRAFTEAVKLNPGEHRLLGNRSFCYEKLQRYEEALSDAEAALGLCPGWAKGLFRRGKALRGLQRYAEAARTFEELLRRDGADAEAAAQLRACRARLPPESASGPPGPGPRPLSQPGSPQSCPGGVPMSPTLLEAGEPPQPLSAAERVSRSCQDTGAATTTSRGKCQPTASSQPALPPTHPARDCFPLWVGNVTPRISEELLRCTFGRFGELGSVRLLRSRRCAFVNYRHKAAAEAAFAAMQDAELGGARLVLQLKHPSHATPEHRRHHKPPPGGLL